MFRKYIDILETLLLFAEDSGAPPISIIIVPPLPALISLGLVYTIGWSQKARKMWPFDPLCHREPNVFLIDILSYKLSSLIHFSVLLAWLSVSKVGLTHCKLTDSSHAIVHGDGVIHVVSWTMVCRHDQSDVASLELLDIHDVLVLRQNRLQRPAVGRLR